MAYLHPDKVYGIQSVLTGGHRRIGPPLRRGAGGIAPSPPPSQIIGQSAGTQRIGPPVMAQPPASSALPGDSTLIQNLAAHLHAQQRGLV